MGLKSRRTKHLLALVLIAFMLVGCTANLNSDGTLIAGREINMSTPWSFSAGWFDFIFVIPIAKLILFIEPYTGIVISLIIVTIALNLLTLPLMVKSTVMSQKMQLLQPQMERIQNKYRGRNDQASKARMSVEINNLYKKHNVKMGQTMLLPFLSMPIMLAMWQAVQRIEIMYQATFLGFNLGALPMQEISAGNYNYIILIVLLGVLQYLSTEIQNILQKISSSRPIKQNKQTKFMGIYMTVIIVLFSLNMPSAMSLYWIVTSLIGIARSVYIHYNYTDKMLLKEEKPNYLTKKNKKR